MKSSSITSLSESLNSQWTAALNMLLELQSRPASEPDWEQVIEMLVAGEFDQRSFVVGELAAEILRDKAPESVRSQFLAHVTQSNDDWLTHFGIVCLRDEELPNWRHLIDTACQSGTWTIRSYAQARRQDVTAEPGGA
jgi:hypothetical protein